MTKKKESPAKNGNGSAKNVPPAKTKPKKAAKESSSAPIFGTPPEGTKHLSGNLYLVPFASIRGPKENPRLLTEQGRSDLLDRDNSIQLRDSICRDTLLSPLVCRWDIEEGKAIPVIVGGDRRHRALEYLIRNKVDVSDPRKPRHNENGEYVNHVTTADEAYEFVTCQVFSCSDDIEALTLAWAENKNRINLTDGHEIRQLMQLRDANATDAQIMQILQRNQKWLADTDRLVQSLDHGSLADLIEGKLDRNAAVELAAIDNLEDREQVRQMANEEAMQEWRKRIQRIKSEIDNAMSKRDVAEGSVVFADSEEERQSAEGDLDVAETEREDSERKLRNTKPRVNTQMVRNASRRVTGRTPNTANKRGPKGGTRNMRNSEIEQGIQFFEALCENKGNAPDGSFSADIDTLELVVKVLKNITSGNKDWIGTLREHFSS